MKLKQNSLFLIPLLVCSLANPWASFAQPSFGTINPIPAPTDLGDITLTDESSSTSAFKQMLDTSRPALFNVNWVPTSGLAYNILDLSEDSASKTNEAARTFFRLHFYQDSINGKYVHYVDLADVVINSSSEFKTFLDLNKGKRYDRLTLKLNHYDAFNGYPYPKEMGLKGAYRIKDERIAGDGVLRTITRYATWDSAVEKTYRVQNYKDYRSAMVDGLTHFYKKFVIEAPVFDETLYNTNKAYKEIQDLSPEVEYSSGIIWSASSIPGSSKSKSPYKGRYTISFNYLDPKQENMSLLQQSMNKASQIVTSTTRPNMSDYDKIMALHDYLVTHTKYNEVAANFELPQKAPHQISGALLDGSAVCSGYAWAMKALIEKAGMECLVVSGDVITGPGKSKSAHAWNMVKLNGKYYHLDSTWDDSDGLDNRFHYGYFLVDDNLLSEDHFWDRSAYPVCSDSSLEYYSLKGWHIQDYAAFQQMMDNRLSAGETSLAFRAENFSRNWMDDKIKDLVFKYHPDWKHYKFENAVQGSVHTLTLSGE